MSQRIQERCHKSSGGLNRGSSRYNLDLISCLRHLTLRILCHLENLFWGLCISSKFCLKTDRFFLGSLLLCIHYQNKPVGILSILPGNLLGQVCNVLTYCTASQVSTTNILPFQLCLTRQSRPNATCLAAIELSVAILVSYY